MNQDFRLDWETRSVLDLQDVGLDVYLSHPSTKIIMANYCRGDRKVQRWEPHLTPKIPAELEDALLDPFTTIYAWGAVFEIGVTRKLLGINKPVDEWFCTMAHARFLGLPGKLHEAGEVVGLKEGEAKLRFGGGKTGKGAALIRLFCEPTDIGGEDTLLGISLPLFNEPWTHPKEWAQFCDYGGGDVIAEGAVEKRIRSFPMPEIELETYRLDQKINLTGWPVDRLTVDGARSIVLREFDPLVQRIKEISGVQNPNSGPQMKAWLSGQGYVFDSLNKILVARALAGECDLTPEAKEVLALRSQTSKSSVSKYTALSDMTSADGRLRHQYTYCGAHTHRWAAHGANMGNLPKPTKAVEKRLNLAVDLVRKMDYDSIKREFEKPLEVASSVLRSAFRAPDGYKFVVADLNAVENRGLGYLARCPSIMNVFTTLFTYNGPDAVEKKTGKPILSGQQFAVDPYINFGVQMFGRTYEDLWVEYAVLGDSTLRTLCKPPVLGGGYQLGAGDEKINEETGLPYWTGLMGYARNMGIELSQQMCSESIKVLREAWKEVKWLWKDMENAAAFAIRHPGHKVGVGVPSTKREEEYFERLGRKVQDPLVHFLCHSDKVLEMLMPSGVSMHYWSPRVEVGEKEWQGKKYTQDCLFYKSKDQKTRQWVETDTYGGHLVENVTQSVCRDVLVHGMKLADKKGFSVVGHTYDELVTLVPVDSGLGVDELSACMSVTPSWCEGALPLEASGFEDVIYRKD